MKIVLAVDGSRYSEAAAAMVGALKPGRQTEIIVLTVIPMHVFLGGHTLAGLLGRSAALRTQIRKAEEEGALQMVTRVSQEFGARGLKAETMVRRGSPADEIIKTCRSLRRDLVVVGLKGMSDAPEFMLGDVAHKVTKYAPCSVLIAKRENKAVNRILVPLDGSKHADEAVQFLLRMPLPRHTEVVLMTVVQSFAAAFVKAYTVDLERDRQIIAELQKAEEEAAQRLMSEAESRFRKGRYRVSATVVRGDPSQQILREAERRDADLIALGAKGLSGARRFLLGSVSQRVARYAKPSVLIVRPQQR